MTNRAIRCFDRPANLETKATKGEQEKEETALGLLELWEVVAVFLGRGRYDGLLQQAVGLASAFRIHERCRLVDDLAIHIRVAAERDELGSRTARLRKSSVDRWWGWH